MISYITIYNHLIIYLILTSFSISPSLLRRRFELWATSTFWGSSACWDLAEETVQGLMTWFWIFTYLQNVICDIILYIHILIYIYDILYIIYHYIMILYIYIDILIYCIFTFIILLVHSSIFLKTYIATMIHVKIFPENLIVLTYGIVLHLYVIWYSLFILILSYYHIVKCHNISFCETLSTWSSDDCMF